MRLDQKEQIMSINTYGSLLVNLLQRLYIGNNHFRKRNDYQLTCHSLREQTFEIEYILTNIIYLIRDVSVIPAFNFKSDHRILNAVFVTRKF